MNKANLNKAPRAIYFSNPYQPFSEHLLDAISSLPFSKQVGGAIPKTVPTITGWSCTWQYRSFTSVHLGRKDARGIFNPSPFPKNATSNDIDSWQTLYGDGSCERVNIHL